MNLYCSFPFLENHFIKNILINKIVFILLISDISEIYKYFCLLGEKKDEICILYEKKFGMIQIIRFFFYFKLIERVTIFLTF